MRYRAFIGFKYDDTTANLYGLQKPIASNPVMDDRHAPCLMLEVYCVSE